MSAVFSDDRSVLQLAQCAPIRAVCFNERSVLQLAHCAPISAVCSI